MYFSLLHKSFIQQNGADVSGQSKLNLYLISVKVVEEGNGEMSADGSDPIKLDESSSKRFGETLMETACPLPLPASLSQTSANAHCRSFAYPF